MPAYPVAAVDNALRLLLLLEDRQVVRVSEAAAELGVGRSTAHRLLAMLQYHGFVRQDPDSRAYVVGSAFQGRQTAGVWGLPFHVDVAARLRPELRALAATTGETVHLGVLNGTSIVIVESVESSRAVRAGGRVGASLPAHCTAAGKAVLAELPLDEVAVLYPHEQLPVRTAASVPTFAALADELAAIQRRGWATSVAESESDVAAVGVALGVAGSRTALSVSAPRYRLPAPRRQACAQLLLAAADAARRTLATGPEQVAREGLSSTR